jgi:hypothetical protein
VVAASSAFSELTMMPANLGLGGVEAVGVAGNERLDDGRAGLERLDEHAARLGAAPGDLRDLPELRSAARKSPADRPRSAPITPTRVRLRRGAPGDALGHSR